MCAISPDLMIYSCPGVYNISEFKIGDLNKDFIDFNKIEAVSGIYNNRNIVKPNPNINVNECQKCDLYNSCDATCIATYLKRQGNNLNIYCDEILYFFIKTFYKYTEKHLWNLYYDNQKFKDDLMDIFKIYN